MAMVSAALMAPALAKKDDPLERLTPVPADQPIPVVDFFRPPLFSGPQLNPAGTHFAAIVSDSKDRYSLLAMEIETGKIERLRGAGAMDIGYYAWLDDRRLLFNLVDAKKYSAGLLAVELGRFTQSYTLQRYNVVDVVGLPKDGAGEVVLWIRRSADRQGEDGGVLKLDTRRRLSSENESEAIYRDNRDDGLRVDTVESYPPLPSGVAVRYLADRRGELAYGVSSESGVFSLWRLEGKAWRRCDLNLDQVSVMAVGDSREELWVVKRQENGRPTGLFRFNAETGAWGELLFADENYDLSGPRFYRHPVTDRLLGVQYQRQAGHSVWFDAEYRNLQSKLDEAFPGEIVRILGSDREERQFFVSVSSDVRPVSYFRVTLKTKSFVRVADSVPWIDPARMRAMQVVSFKTRDGKQVEGYLTLPEGASKSAPAPLVVLPHGGPWARDNWGWDGEVQFLASRGYAVFQPNYRGSPGYGWRFSDEDLWDFRKMHEDVTDGVKMLFRTGLVDRDRVAIMGGSFGGYLALCGAVEEEGFYRCAVTIAGVFDWDQVMKEARGNEQLRSRYGVLRRMLGDPGKNKEKFEAISPLRRVDRIKIPVFVAHGTEDFVASSNQSRRLIAELKKHRIPHEKHFEQGEGHAFRWLESRVELYTAIEAFLGKNMAPRAEKEAVGVAGGGAE